MCSLDVSNSATRANAISRFLLVSLDVDAILAEATIHKKSTPIVPINPADPALAGCRSGKAILRAGRCQLKAQVNPAEHRSPLPPQTDTFES